MTLDTRHTAGWEPYIIYTCYDTTNRPDGGAYHGLERTQYWEVVYSIAS